MRHNSDEIFASPTNLNNFVTNSCSVFYKKPIFGRFFVFIFSEKTIPLKINYIIQYRMNIKNLFATLAIAFSFVLLTACGGSAQKETLTVDNVLSDPAAYVGQTVTVEGVCSHVCSKSGMKLFIQGASEDKTLRAESNSRLGKFDEESVDKKVRVKGTLVEDRITEADVQEMEKEIIAGTQVSHGEGGDGCETEQLAEGVAVGSSEMDRVNNFRARIAERKAEEGKDYLSFYHIDADSYHIVKQ